MKLYYNQKLQTAFNLYPLYFKIPNPRINFNEDREVDLSNSETMKLVHELDNKGPEPEPGNEDYASSLET